MTGMLLAEIAARRLTSLRRRPGSRRSPGSPRACSTHRSRRSRSPCVALGRAPPGHARHRLCGAARPRRLPRRCRRSTCSRSTGRSAPQGDPGTGSQAARREHLALFVRAHRARAAIPRRAPPRRAAPGRARRRDGRGARQGGGRADRGRAPGGDVRRRPRTVAAAAMREGRTGSRASGSSCSGRSTPMLAQTAEDVRRGLERARQRRASSGSSTARASRSIAAATRSRSSRATSPTSPSACRRSSTPCARSTRRRDRPRRRGDRAARRRAPRTVPGDDEPLRDEGRAAPSADAAVGRSSSTASISTARTSSTGPRASGSARSTRVVPRAPSCRASRPTTPEAAQAFLDDALARGHEGVMVKSLDAPYEAGRRGAGWLKVKPAHTLDLVVLAVEWGNGRRTGQALEPPPRRPRSRRRRLRHARQDVQGHDRRDARLADGASARARDAHARATSSTSGPSSSSRSRSTACRRARSTRAAWRCASRA